MTTAQKEFHLEMTLLPREQVKDVLRGLLHSIFFHRLLMNVLPRELRVLNTAVSITDNKDVESLIEEKIAEFLHNSSSPTQTRQLKLAVLFYDKKPKSRYWPFNTSDEFACWEQWEITLYLIQTPASEQEKAKVVKSVEKQFTQCLMKILQIVNDYKEHIPSITTTEGNPFPYQIAIQSQSENWSSTKKKVTVADAPTIEKSRSSSSNNNPIKSTGSSNSRPPSLNLDRRMS